MNESDLKQRTKEFAKRIILLCRALPQTREGRLVGDQVFRSGTSVGANYRAACRGRSRADFVSKLGISLEEADESEYWLELICETGMLSPPQVRPLLQEAGEIVAILNKSIATTRRNDPTNQRYRRSS